MDENVKIWPDYNLLRHAGTIYALATVKENFPDSTIDRAIIRTAGWLKNQIGPLYKNNDSIKALWTSSLEISHGINEAKLGGAGLGLVALVKAREVNSSLIDVEELEKLAAFVEFMQKPDGSFHSKWEQGKGVGSFHSLYYPGEACLGLMMLHQHTHNPRWFRVALKAMKYLALSRQSQTTTEVLPDHWALISTRELMKSPLILEHDKQILLRHAQKVSLLINLTKNTDLNAIISPVFVFSNLQYLFTIPNS